MPNSCIPSSSWSFSLFLNWTYTSETRQKMEASREVAMARASWGRKESWGKMGRMYSASETITLMVSRTSTYTLLVSL